MDNIERQEIQNLCRKYNCHTLAQVVIENCTSNGRVNKKALARSGTIRQAHIQPAIDKLRSVLKDYDPTKD